MKLGRILGSAIALLLALSGQAAAADRTVVMRAGPYNLNGFETLRPKVMVESPQVDGFITYMHSRLVDRRGRAVKINRVMLHHVVFINQGRWPGDRKPKCGTRFGEPFYGTGEENQALDLPAGYGYRIRPGDRWKMQTMLMSHSTRKQRVFVEYRMRVSQRRLDPVTPYWVRVTNCRNDPSWSVSGGGPPGSYTLRTRLWPVPVDGLLVAGGAHLHGGAHNITIRQPSCRGRRLVQSDPSYGLPDDISYTVRPILHEPGPINTSWFKTRAGIPLKDGDRLRVTANYDAHLPHMGVMGVWHVYIAEGRRAARRARAAERCAELPADLREIRTKRPHRDHPPPITIPLTHLVDGRPVTLDHPKGPLKWFSSPLERPQIEVDDGAYSPVNLSVPAGTTLTWHFDDVEPHKVQLANGPRAMGSPTLSGGGRYQRTFTVPGVYQLFCYLHPMTMHQEVTVRPHDGVAADPDEGSEAVGEEDTGP